MEVLAIIFYLVLISAIITSISALLFRSRGPWGSYWSSFLIIFLFIWIVSIWVRPIGPVYYGLALAPIAFIGVIIAILLIAVTPPHFRSRKGKIYPNTIGEEKTSVAPLVADIFFWTTVLILIAAIVVGYMNPH